MWSKVNSDKSETYTEMKKCWFYSVSVTRCLPNLKQLTLASGKTSCKTCTAAWEKDRDKISAIPCFKLVAVPQTPILFYSWNEVSVWNKYLVSTIHNRHSWSTGTQTPLIPVGLKSGILTTGKKFKTGAWHLILIRQHPQKLWPFHLQVCQSRAMRLAAAPACCIPVAC